MASTSPHTPEDTANATIHPVAGRSSRSSDVANLTAAAGLPRQHSSYLGWVDSISYRDRDFDRSGVNSDDNPNETKLGETFPNSNVYLNKDVGMGDLMFAAAHEAWLHVNLGGLSDAGEKPNDVWESSIAEKQNKAGYARWNLAIYRQLPLNLRQSATEALNMVGVRP